MGQSFQPSGAQSPANTPEELFLIVAQVHLSRLEPALGHHQILAKAVKIRPRDLLHELACDEKLLSTIASIPALRQPLRDVLNVAATSSSVVDSAIYALQQPYKFPDAYEFHSETLVRALVAAREKDASSFENVRIRIELGLSGQLAVLASRGFFAGLLLFACGSSSSLAAMPPAVVDAVCGVLHQTFDNLTALVPTHSTSPVLAPLQTEATFAIMELRHLGIKGIAEEFTNFGPLCHFAFKPSAPAPLRSFMFRILEASIHVSSPASSPIAQLQADFIQSALDGRVGMLELVVRSPQSLSKLDHMIFEPLNFYVTLAQQRGTGQLQSVQTFNSLLSTANSLVNANPTATTKTAAGIASIAAAAPNTSVTRIQLEIATGQQLTAVLGIHQGMTSLLSATTEAALVSAFKSGEGTTWLAQSLAGISSKTSLNIVLSAPEAQRCLGQAIAWCYMAGCAEGGASALRYLAQGGMAESQISESTRSAVHYQVCQFLTLEHLRKGRLRSAGRIALRALSELVSDKNNPPGLIARPTLGTLVADFQSGKQGEAPSPPAPLQRGLLFSWRLRSIRKLTK